MATTLSKATVVGAKRNLNSVLHQPSPNFKEQAKRCTTEVPEAFRESIDDGKGPLIEWSVSANSNTYQPGAARCNLCLDGKLALLPADPSSVLNKKRKSPASAVIKINSS